MTPVRLALGLALAASLACAPTPAHARSDGGFSGSAAAAGDAGDPADAVDAGTPPASDDAPTAAGAIPEGLPHALSVGLFEDTGQGWMKASGVPFQLRYRYFTKGWVNNWGYGADDGSWGLDYLRECDGQGFVPVVEYYEVNGEPGGGEGQFLAKVRDAATMRSYFRDFLVLMQRAKEFGKPVVVLVEADGFGFLEQQSGDDPNAAAAVASTGLPELAGLPDTVAGWGLAFLALREAAGAGNVVLGLHVSAWASGKDVAYFSVTDPLGPEVDKVDRFLAPFGLDPNVTGATWDLLVGDPLDRDSDYYRLVRGEDRWWDPADDAPVASKSFNRYAEWLRLWNVKARRRWVLWQIPLGNRWERDVANDGSPRAGWRDNRTEYFFGDGGAAHRDLFARAGVVALLFGQGEPDQSSYENDLDDTGAPYLGKAAGAFLGAGGLPLR